jgi:hypothetical protein
MMIFVIYTEFNDAVPLHGLMVNYICQAWISALLCKYVLYIEMCRLTNASNVTSQATLLFAPLLERIMVAPVLHALKYSRQKPEELTAETTVQWTSNFAKWAHCDKKVLIILLNIKMLDLIIGARNSVVGWDTTLQTGRSRFRFPMK